MKPGLLAVTQMTAVQDKETNLKTCIDLVQRAAAAGAKVWTEQNRLFAYYNWRILYIEKKDKILLYMILKLSLRRLCSYL